MSDILFHPPVIQEIVQIQDSLSIKINGTVTGTIFVLLLSSLAQLMLPFLPVRTDSHYFSVEHVFLLPLSLASFSCKFLLC